MGEWTRGAWNKSSGKNTLLTVHGDLGRRGLGTFAQSTSLANQFLHLKA